MPSDAIAVTVGVEIRHYPSMAAFQADAATMAAAGWKVVAQSSSSKMSGAGTLCGVLGVLLIFGGLISLISLVAGIAFVLIGAVSRQTTYTVTYQPQTSTPN